MITIIMNHSVLSNEDLALQVAETMDVNNMHHGLWGIKVDKNGNFDCSFMFRDSTDCNVIINKSK